MEKLFELPDSKKMAYYEWRTEGPPTKEGSTPVVIVCVHGITMFGLIFEFLAKGLIKDAQKRGIDCRLYAVDLLGRGESDWLDPSEGYKPQTFGKHMSLFIEMIATANGVDAVNYIGTSFGGMIGMGLFYTGFGKRISKIVLNDVGASLDNSGLSRVSNRLATDITFDNLDGVEQFYRENSKGLGILSDEEWRQIATYGTKKMKDSDKYCFKRDPRIHTDGSHQESVPLWEYYEKIDCPILIIHGVNSDILQAETVEEMKVRGPSGQKGLVQSVDIPNTGHAPLLNTPYQIESVAKFLFGDSRSGLPAE